jgi:predicted nucleic acid-binding protein
MLLGVDQEIDLVVSTLVLEETQRNLEKKALRAIPALEAFIDMGLLELSDPSIEGTRDVARFIEAKDAPIVAGAIAATCAYLATFDRQHLLSQAVRIHEAWGIDVRDPREILASVRGRLPNR